MPTKIHRRIGSFAYCKDHTCQFSRFKSVSLENKTKKKVSLRSTLLRPYYIMETDSAVFPKNNQLGKIDMGNFQSKFLPQYHNPAKGRQKNKSKQKTSRTKFKQSKSKSKSKSKSRNSKSFKGYKGRSSFIAKPKGSKQKSDKSRSTKHKKQPSTKQFSIDKFSKTHKVTHQKSKSSHKNKSKSKGTRWQQILQLYGQYLAVAQITQIRQTKTIYFLGKIKQRKSKQLFSGKKNVHCSDRKHHNNSQLHQDTRPFYNQLLSERRHDIEGENQIIMPEDDFYRYQIGDHIAYRYQIISSIDKGAFGDVLKVFDHKQKEYVALKIVRKSPQLVPQTQVEIQILTHILEKDKQGLSGIVKIRDFTIFRKHICIFFELLQGNLFELITANNYNGLPQSQIKLFAIQLLNSLQFLRKQKIIHCDLKPENIVMSKWGKTGIKIIDFGTSCFQGRQMYEYLQSRYYRSPEIILGTGYSYPIDMWSLACILAELRIGEPIFAGSCDLSQLMYFCNAIGLPQQEDGPVSKNFLHSNQIQHIIENQYLQEYKKVKNRAEFKTHQLFSKFKYITSSMVPFQQKLKELDQNQDLFIDFIEKILVWEPSKRMTPSQALQHPWILKYLPKQIKKLYKEYDKVKRQATNEKQTFSKSISKGKKKKSNSKHHKRRETKSLGKQAEHHKSRHDSRSKDLPSQRKRKKSSQHRYEKLGIPLLSVERDNFFKAKLKGIVK